MQGHVGRKPRLAPVITTVDHNRFAYAVEDDQRRFDIAEFNAMPTDFHLIIATSDEEQGAVILITGQVARAIHADLVVAERIGAEGLGGALRIA